MSKRHCSLAVLLVVFLAGLPAIAFGQVTVTLTLDDDQAAEAGPDTASLTVTRDVLSPQSLTVLLNGSGTATRGTDWNGSGGNFTALSATTFRMVILPNQLSATATLTPNKDNIIEGEENFSFVLAPPGAGTSGYTIGAQDSGGFTIADDVAEVTLEMTDGVATEAGPTPATLVVRRSDNGQVEGALTVQMNGSGTATRGTDWNGSGGNFTALSATTFRMVILPNQLSATATLTPRQDAIDDGESDESFTFTVAPPGAGTSGYTIGTPDSGTFTIVNFGPLIFKDGLEP